MTTNEKLEYVEFVGPPASGKTTETEKYRQNGYDIFSSDDIRAEIQVKIDNGEFIIPDNTNLNALVFDTINKLTVQSLKNGKSVVVDATNLGRKRRMNFKRSLYKIDCLKTCVIFITSIDECMRRNALRFGKARVPDEAMYGMFCSYECPNYWEGWDNIIPVIDDKPFTFDFSKTIGFSQDNPYHTLTLDEHMQAAHRFAVESGFNPTVQKVARYHDIGKLYTKRFENRRGERTEKAHFYGHENYGAYLYLTEMCCGKTISQEEFKQILYETNLINCHMRPLNLWSENNVVREKDKKLFGESFFEDLINLNKCDKAAH